jgi:hypothetical protein
VPAEVASTGNGTVRGSRSVIVQGLLVEPLVTTPLPDGGLIDRQLLAEVRARHRFRRKAKR